MTNNSLPINENKRIFWVDALKGFAILTVIFLHSHNGQNTDGTVAGHIIKWITSYHMTLFFACAGFFFSLPSTAEKVKHQIKNKCKTLLVPYLIWGVLIGFLVENGRLLIRTNASLNIASIIVKIVTARASYLASWFLWVLLGVYCIQYVIAMAVKSSPIKEIIWIIANIIMLPLGYLMLRFWGVGIYRINLIIASCFFFTLGSVMRRFLAFLDQKRIVYRIILCFVAISVGGIICFINGLVTYSGAEFGNPLLHTISAMFTIFGLFLAFSLFYNKNLCNNAKKLLEYLGKNSIIVLLTHLILLYGIRILEKLLGMKIHTFPGILAFLIITIAELIIIKLIPKKVQWVFGR